MPLNEIVIQIRTEGENKVKNTFGKLDKTMKKFKLHTLAMLFVLRRIGSSMMNLARPAMEVSGTFEILSSFLSVVFLPVAAAMNDLILGLWDAFDSLPEPIKKVVPWIIFIGGAILLLTAFLEVLIPLFGAGGIGGLIGGLTGAGAAATTAAGTVGGTVGFWALVGAIAATIAQFLGLSAALSGLLIYDDVTAKQKGYNSVLDIGKTALDTISEPIKKLWELYDEVTKATKKATDAQEEFNKATKFDFFNQQKPWEVVTPGYAGGGYANFGNGEEYYPESISSPEAKTTNIEQNINPTLNLNIDASSFNELTKKAADKAAEIVNQKVEDLMRQIAFVNE